MRKKTTKKKANPQLWQRRLRLALLDEIERIAARVDSCNARSINTLGLVKADRLSWKCDYSIALERMNTLNKENDRLSRMLWDTIRAIRERSGQFAALPDKDLQSIVGKMLSVTPEKKSG